MTVNEIKGDTNLKTDVKKILMDFVAMCWSERSDIDIHIVAPGNDRSMRRIDKRLSGKLDLKTVKSDG